MQCYRQVAICILVSCLSAHMCPAGEFVDDSELPAVKSFQEAVEKKDKFQTALRVERVLPADSKVIRQFSKVSVLSLKAADVDELDLSFLEDFVNLQILHLEGFDLREVAATDHIANRPNLEIVEYTDCLLPVGLIVETLRNGALKKFGLRNSHIYDGEAKFDNYEGHVTHLSANGAIFVPPSAAKFIGRLRTLEWLDMTLTLDTPKLIANDLPDFNSLVHCGLAVTNVDDIFLSRVLALPRIESLDLFGCKKFLGKSLPKNSLEHLVVGGRLIPADQWSWLAKCPKLKSLEVRFHNFDEASWSSVSSLSTLERLSLSGCEVGVGPSFDNLELPNLRELEIGLSASLTDTRFARWIEGKVLHRISLSECEKISDQAIGALANLPIKDVRLGYSEKITNAGIQALAESKSITSVELVYLSGVTIDAISHLVKESGIKALTLSGFSLSKEELEQLKGMSPDMKIVTHE